MGRGGARPNSGGRRPGAGRPRKAPVLLNQQSAIPIACAEPHPTPEPKPILAIAPTPAPKPAAEPAGKTLPAAYATHPQPTPAPVIAAPRTAAATELDSIRLLREVVNSENVDLRLRIEAAKALAPYEATKIGEVGKKEGKAEAAKKVASGRFAPAAPPKLVVSNPKK